MARRQGRGVPRKVGGTCIGSESAGLPASVRARFAPAQILRLPMRPDNRSLNLSNAVAVTVFEAWRQIGFAGSQNP